MCVTRLPWAHDTRFQQLLRSLCNLAQFQYSNSLAWLVFGLRLLGGLLITLTSLSLLAIYWAEAENVQAHKHRTWRWRAESTVHAASVRLLIMWIPILNLVEPRPVDLTQCHGRGVNSDSIAVIVGNSNTAIQGLLKTIQNGVITFQQAQQTSAQTYREPLEVSSIRIGCCN